jgi:hypothetical protein
MKSLRSFLCLVVAAMPLFLFAKDGIQPTSVLQNNRLLFIENKGQITDQFNNTRKDIQFKLTTPGMNIFIGNGQIHYQWSKTEAMEPKDLRHWTNDAYEVPEELNIETYRIDVILVGANANAELVINEKQEYYENHYLPQYPDGITAHSFKKITYKNVYPNIDWILYVYDNKLKYDFVVLKGGNVKDIKIQYNGATSLTIQDSAFVATTPFGSITEEKPYCYESESLKEIKSAFDLQNNVLTFDLAAYDKQVIIDPQLLWATYYVGTGDETMCGITSDIRSNVYVVGDTKSTSNIATTGAFKSIMTGVNEGFIVKFDKTGVRSWGTYFGGTCGTRIWDVSHDDSGHIYFAGETSCTGLGTTGVHKSIGQSYDAFLAKFDTTGSRIWVTYNGGNLDEGARAVGLDKHGNIFISGWTNSTDGIATTGCHQAIKETAYDAFLAKFNSLGIRLWGTYYGGGGQETGLSICTDSQDNVYLGGNTNSFYNIGSPGSHKATITGSTHFDEAFLAKFSPAGVRHWGTYYGGNDQDYIADICYDGRNNVYICGYTDSRSGVASPNGYDTSFGGGSITAYSFWDAFIARFDTGGNRKWGTYYGVTKIPMNSYDRSVSISTDYNRDIYLFGLSESYYIIPYEIATPGSFKSVPIAISDYFIVKFDSSCNRHWASYFGGDGGEGTASSIRQGAMTYNSLGDLFITGCTNSTDSLVTAGCHQATIGGGLVDGFVAKFPIQGIHFKQPFIDTLLCGGDTLNVIYGTSQPFNSGNMFTVQLSDNLGTFATAINIGSITSVAPGVIPCVIPFSTTYGTRYRLRIISSSPADTFFDNGIDITIRPGLLPSITTSTVPSTNTGPWNSILFTAIPTNGGTTPTYQWTKNGIDIFGATSITYSATTATNLVTGDIICVKLKSNAVCVKPDTAKGCAPAINIDLKVKNEKSEELQLYPNPNNGNFLIEGRLNKVDEATIEILNGFGQLIYREKFIPIEISLEREINIECGPGIYTFLLKQGPQTIKTIRFTVEH